MADHAPADCTDVASSSSSSPPPTHAILLFYHYGPIEDVTVDTEWHRAFLQAESICGRLRIAPSGLNGTLSGLRLALEKYAAAVSARLSTDRIDWKISFALPTQLFDSLSVRAVDEVVSLGVAESSAPLTEAGQHIPPSEFHRLLETEPPENLVLLDVRNIYETRIGRFTANGVPTLLPPVRQFSDLPAWLDEHVEELNGKTVLAYCTGGVRCESATAYLRHSHGLGGTTTADDGTTTNATNTNVLQLEGGIERYLDAFPSGGFFAGKNHVFDRRMRVAPPERPPGSEGDVIGTCMLCEALTDDYSPQCRCSRCRLLLLVCRACCDARGGGSSGSDGDGGRLHSDQRFELLCEGCAAAPPAAETPRSVGKSRSGRRKHQQQQPQPPSEPPPTDPPPGPPGDDGPSSEPPPEALPQRENRRKRRQPAAEPADESASSSSAAAAMVVEEQPAAAADDDAWARGDAPLQYEYLDHTADVQIHSWGSTTEEAFEQMVIGVMGLITDDLTTVNVNLEKVVASPSSRRDVAVEGHDLPSLLYNFLDEWLFQFNADQFLCRRVKVTTLNRESWAISSVGVGELFDRGRHPPGIEVKAITYSALRVTEEDGRTDLLVIVDV